MGRLHNLNHYTSDGGGDGDDGGSGDGDDMVAIGT